MGLVASAKKMLEASTATSIRTSSADLTEAFSVSRESLQTLQICKGVIHASLLLELCQNNILL